MLLLVIIVIHVLKNRILIIRMLADTCVDAYYLLFLGYSLNFIFVLSFRCRKIKEIRIDFLVSSLALTYLYKKGVQEKP